MTLCHKDLFQSAGLVGDHPSSCFEDSGSTAFHNNTNSPMLPPPGDLKHLVQPLQKHNLCCYFLNTVTDFKWC